jgi:hypothetical protein
VQYIMMPLDEHSDDGFGATAEAFFRAALVLRDKDERHLFFEHLPQNYLLRHAMELFLKSGIIIIHRKLKIPFGDQPSTAQPKVPVESEWVPFYRVHSIAALYEHWKSLINSNLEILKNLCEFKPDWTVDPQFDDCISFIEKTDPNSTYYRYPSNRDPNEDKNKSPFKETAKDDIFPADLPPDKKVKAFVIEDKNREFVRAFVLDDKTEKDATEALLKGAEILNNYHAMMRIELTGGW